MIVVEDEESDEKARTLRRKLLNNVVEAKLKNTREKERLNRTLDDLAKEEEREMRNIHRNLVSLRRELNGTATNASKSSERNLSVKSGIHTHVVDVGDTIPNMRKIKSSKQGDRDERLHHGNHSKGASRSPMTFLELKRLSPLESTENGLVVWPLPFRCDKSLEFPATVKQRKSLTLPKIEISDDVRSGRQKRFQSSGDVLAHTRKIQLAQIERHDALNNDGTGGIGTDGNRTDKKANRTE